MGLMGDQGAADGGGLVKASGTRGGDVGYRALKLSITVRQRGGWPAHWVAAAGVGAGAEENSLWPRT
jgi:hypothetical protein